MTDRPAHQEFGRIALKWRDLAERRRVYYAELYRSGRWKLYYTEDELLLRMRDVVSICERWARIVSQEAPSDELSMAAGPPAAAAQTDPRRDAA